jgi:hypothetical protein
MEIVFSPTYKYQRGSKVYTTEKSRTPSFCDRILYKSLPNCEIEPTVYTSADEIGTSDHKPVYALFTVSTELPFLSIFASTNVKCKIILSNVYMSDREGPPLIKPKLNFYGQWLEKQPYKSTYQGFSKSTFSNPQFNDAAIPELTPIICNLEHLSRQHLHIILRDKSLSQDANENVIGITCLSVLEACQSLDENVNFALDLCHRTTLVGRLHGTIRLRTIPE